MIARLCGSSSLNFLKILHTVFHSICTTSQSYPQCKRVSIFPHLPLYLFSAFLCHHPNGYEIISHYGFITFLSWLIILCIFSYACSIFFIFEEEAIQVIAQFLIRLLDFFALMIFFFNIARLNKLSSMYYFYNMFKDCAAAAAKSLRSCLTLCDPIDGSPPGSPVPGVLQARTLEWVAVSFSKGLCYSILKSSLFLHLS